MKGALPHTVERAIASAVQRPLRHCAVVQKKKEAKSWFFIPFYSFSQPEFELSQNAVIAGCCEGPRRSCSGFFDLQHAWLGVHFVSWHVMA